MERTELDAISLREPNIVIRQRLHPVHALEIHLLITLVVLEYRKKVLSFRGAQDFGLLWKVWHKDKDEKGDEDRNEALDYEDPSETF